METQTKKMGKTITTEINLSEEGARKLIEKLNKTSSISTPLGYIDLTELSHIVRDYTKLARITREAN